jgi:ascorbate-specific PTS system EIIC-type component UlaA
MNQTQSTTVSGGGIAAVLLSGLFVWLKVSGVAPFATWDWIWVFAPLWIGFAIFLAIAIIIFLTFIFATLVSDAMVQAKRKKAREENQKLEKERQDKRDFR